MKNVLSVALVVALLAAGLNAEILEQVLVKVNGEIITQTEFQRVQLTALRDLPNPPDPSRTSDAELAKIFAQVNPQAIVGMIDEMLLMQRAKELGMSVSDAQFSEVLDSIKKDNKIESEAAFEAALKSEGMTLAQLKTILSKRILIGQVQRRMALIAQSANTTCPTTPGSIGTRLTPKALAVASTPCPRIRPSGVPLRISSKVLKAPSASPNSSKPPSIATATVFPASMVSRPMSLHSRVMRAM